MYINMNYCSNLPIAHLLIDSHNKTISFSKTMPWMATNLRRSTKKRPRAFSLSTASSSHCGQQRSCSQQISSGNQQMKHNRWNIFSQQMKLVQQMKQWRETSISWRTAYGILENSQEQSSKSAVTDRGGAIMVRVLKTFSKYKAKTGTSK